MDLGDPSDGEILLVTVDVMSIDQINHHEHQPGEFKVSGNFGNGLDILANAMLKSIVKIFAAKNIKFLLL